MIWMAIMLGAAGTYVEKLIGFILPASTLDRPIVRSIAGLLPVSLLAALVIVQTFAAGQAVAVDARLAGLAAAIVALVLRAPFLVVILVAAITAGLLRAAGLAE